MVFPSLLCALLTLTNAADVASAVGDYRDRTPFALTGTVACVVEPVGKLLVLTDGSGSATLIDDRPPSRKDFRCRPGDVLRVAGNVSRDRNHVSAPCTEVVRLGHRPPPAPQDTTVAAIKAGRHDCCFVRVGGIVRESFRDEIDPNFIYLVLGNGDNSLYAAVYADEREADGLRTLTGSDVTVQGIVQPEAAGQRVQLGRVVMLCSVKAVSVRKYARDAPFDVPQVDGSVRLSPDRILALGRRRIAGRVLAVWQNDRAVLEDDGGGVHNVTFVEGELPPYGERIEAEGFAATDLYRINLTGATWRPRPSAHAMTNAPPDDVSADDLFGNGDGQRKLKVKMHGRTVRLRGTVLDLPARGDPGRLILKSGGYTVPVDASACRQALDGVSVGCEVEATGCCIVETENWHSYSAFPHATGVAVVLRTPEDLVVLAAPPWWTPGRLLVVIGTLFAFLAVLFVWSISLWGIAARRGRQVLKAQVQRISSDLRVEERTRLAVELHDSLSQTLTGVSMEIAAANDLGGGVPAEMSCHLARANRTLKACRDELRNCLWDLRSAALDEPDMNQAIRRTLQPHIDGPQLVIRFSVPRAHISDNTAHTLLRMIRELVVNALRHGHATTVKIAGSLDAQGLYFSVRDNGCGFDPDAAPGILQGHFGLQGVRERLERLGGTLEIESRPGHGTRVSGRIPAHSQKGGEEVKG